MLIYRYPQHFRFQHTNKTGFDTAIFFFFFSIIISSSIFWLIKRCRKHLKWRVKSKSKIYLYMTIYFQPGHRVPRFGTVNWAVCTPASCSAQDVEASLRHTLDKHTTRTGLNITIQVDSEMCQLRRKDSYPTETIVAR